MPNGHGGIPKYGSPILLAILFGLLLWFRSDTNQEILVPVLYAVGLLFGWRLAWHIFLYDAMEYDGGYTDEASMKRAKVRYYAALLGIEVALVYALYFLLSPKPPYNVIIISLDTLRADRLGTYGYERTTSPAIDELANGSLVFEHAIAPAPWTLPSHVSLFTGLYPTSHGVTRADNRPRIPGAAVLLSEVLQQRGYQTHAITGGGYVAPVYGFKRGFHSYQVIKNRGGGNARRLVKRAISLIEKYRATQTPYFLFLHTYDIHCPYSPPEPYFSMFGTFDSLADLDFKKCGEHFTSLGLNSEQARLLSDRYDGNIRWVDENLAKLFDYLRSTGEIEQTVVVLTSDHGEEFLEHGRIGHRYSLHRELLEIPLIVRVPGIRPRRITSSVSLVDIAPTLYELLEIPVSEVLDGRSLVPVLLERGEREPRPFEFAELDRDIQLRTRYDNGSQLIVNLEKNSYDLIDFNELKSTRGSLVEQGSNEVRERFDALVSFMKRFRSIPREEIEQLPKENIEQLKTLGYL